jgi:hypothetical protein
MDTDIRFENTEIKGKVTNDFNRITLTSRDRISGKDGAIRLTGADPFI